ncbi:flagellar export chaperone FlgN [Intestinibacillus sp. Marseille-P6563]|uniref:flagellar export chaperone FlgN n=1 Tax=Intestinibacillus sp. Marseille-P6563 TaxID=2364792 RepID=UPI000F06ED98|nr:flagellar export chaperone FlgN [Intestinibacillus sp. Marseille-P6563]
MSNQFDGLIQLMQDLTKTLTQLTAVQKDVASAVHTDDLTALGECMKKENVLALTLRNIDQKREKVQQQLGLEGVKLSELPGKVSDEEARPKVKQTAEELQAQYRVMQSAAEVARSALECSLYEVENMMTKMGIDPRQVEQQPASSNGAHTDFRA